MRVFVRGQWYDADQEPIAVCVNAGEKKQIATMQGDYYSQYPEKLGERFGKSALDNAVKLDLAEKES